MRSLRSTDQPLRQSYDPIVVDLSVMNLLEGELLTRLGLGSDGHHSNGASLKMRCGWVLKVLARVLNIFISNIHSWALIWIETLLLLLLWSLTHIPLPNSLCFTEVEVRGRVLRGLRLRILERLCSLLRSLILQLLRIIARVSPIRITRQVAFVNLLSGI